MNLNSKTSRGIIGGVTASLVLVASLILGQKKEEVEEPRARLAYDASQTFENADTRDTAYRFSKPTGNLSKPVEYRVMMDRVDAQLVKHKGDGYRMKPQGGEFGKVIRLKAVRKRLPIRIANLPHEETWVVRCMSDGHTIRIKKVDLNPAMVINTPGTPAIDIIVGTVAARFGNVPIWGVCVCKKIAGTNTWSQHAYCNAIDYGGDRTRLDRVATYIRGLDTQGYVPVAEILWQVPNHYAHIHFTGAPRASGTPTAC